MHGIIHLDQLSRHIRHISPPYTTLILAYMYTNILYQQWCMYLIHFSSIVLLLSTMHFFLETSENCSDRHKSCLKDIIKLPHAIN